MLEERIETLEERLSMWMRTANILSGVGALVAVVAIVGWLAALGALSIPWLDSPVVEIDGAPGDGVPDSTGSEGGGEEVHEFGIASISNVRNPSRTRVDGGVSNFVDCNHDVGCGLDHD